MTSLRSLAEKDLRHIIEGEFAVPVILVSPAGERIDHAADGRFLSGRVLWSHTEITPEGETVIVPAPVVELRESSLPAVPKSGEAWIVMIPESPAEGSPLKTYLLDTASVVEAKRNFGIISLPLLETEE